MQQVVRAALGVGELEGSGPRPSYAAPVKVGDCDGALRGAPGCREGVGACGAVRVCEVWQAQDVGVIRGGPTSFESPSGGGGVPGSSSWVAVDEANNGEGAPVGFRFERARGQLA